MSSVFLCFSSQLWWKVWKKWPKCWNPLYPRLTPPDASFPPSFIPWFWPSLSHIFSFHPFTSLPPRLFCLSPPQPSSSAHVLLPSLVTCCEGRKPLPFPPPLHSSSCCNFWNKTTAFAALILTRYDATPLKAPNTTWLQHLFLAQQSTE